MKIVFFSSAGKAFKDDILKAHNYCRKEHSSPALKWSGKLAAEAQKAADDAAKTNTLKPVSLSNVGQNMAAMSGGQLTGQRVTEMWYEEEKNYNYSSPGFSSSTGKDLSINFRNSSTCTMFGLSPRLSVFNVCSCSYAFLELLYLE